jgi:hypothetical protein
VKIQIKSTTKIVQLNGVPARIWEGETESGIPVHCYVTRIQVQKDLDASQFERELQEHAKPSVDIQGIPLHLILLKGRNR